MIAKILTAARAAAFSLVVMVGFTLPAVAIASPAMAPMAPTVTAAGGPTLMIPAMKGPAMKGPVMNPAVKIPTPVAPSGSAKKKTNHATSPLLTYLAQHFVRAVHFVQPYVKEFVSLIPALWQGLQMAILLIFLVCVVVYHFQRQRRALLEAEQEKEPQAAELEFGSDPDLARLSAEERST